jgi:hypothetical protein
MKMGKHTAAEARATGLAPPAVIDELDDAAALADEAAERAETAAVWLEQRRAERDVAIVKAEQAEDAYWRSIGQADLALHKLTTMLKTAGLVRTADGYRPA